MTTEEFINSISLEGEKWRDVVGYEGLYLVSSYGRICSQSRILHTSKGVMRKYNPHLMTLDDRRGYLGCQLVKNGDRTHKLVHRLEAEAFIPNPENKPHIDHINGIKTDNNLENLRWVTPYENMNNPITLAKVQQGIKEWCLKNKAKPIVGIPLNGGEILKFSSMVEAYRNFGFSDKQVAQTCKGERYSYKGYRWMYLSDYEISCQ